MEVVSMGIGGTYLSRTQTAHTDGKFLLRQNPPLARCHRLGRCAPHIGRRRGSTLISVSATFGLRLETQNEGFDQEIVTVLKGGNVPTLPAHHEGPVVHL